MKRGVRLATGLAGTLLAASGVSAAGPALPIVFEANHGQVDAPVKFLSRSPGYALFATTSDVILADRRSSHTVRLRLLGARQDLEVTALKPLPGRIHYFLGRNPANWRTNVPTYAAVAYRDAYPGIDALYKADTGARIEQEFVVRPGGDPAAINLGFEGVRDASVDAAGDLVLTTEGSAVRLSRPIAYQEINGARREIRASWVVRGPTAAGFELGPHDRSHPLVIDPVIAWATLLGGSGDDQAFGVAADVVGNVYVTGDTTSLDFPEIGSSTLAGGIDAFVSKLDANGQILLYSTYIGGVGTDGGRAIAVDTNNNAYLAGFTSSANFPTTSGAFQALPQGDFDGFVVRLDPNGMITFATFLGGSGSDTAFGIVVDGSGRAHVAGGTRSTNFPTANPLQPALGGGTCGTPPTTFDCRDAFVVRLSAIGNVTEYSTFLGGTNDDVANAIALDGNGNVYLTGFTLSTDFPTTTGSLQPSPAAGLDAFVARVNANGSLEWSTYLGGLGADTGNGIAVDGAGRPTVVGSTASTNFPTTSGDVFSGVTEGFATKLNATGSGIAWSRSMGSAVPTAVALDTLADPHIVANNLVCTAPTLPLGCSESHVDVVVNKRSGIDGDSLDIITFGGRGNLAAGQDFAQAIATRIGSVWVAGFTLATNFPTTPGTVQSTHQGGADAFVVKLVDTTAAVPDGGSGDSCVIATAAFGSPLAGEVQTLRQFRDRALLTNTAGRLLVRAYYTFSPPLARAVTNTPVLAAAVRGLLRPVALGARLSLDRHFGAVALAGAGFVVIAGLGMRGTRSRRIRRAVIACLLIGMVLLAGALLLGAPDATLRSVDSPAPKLAPTRDGEPQPRLSDGAPFPSSPIARRVSSPLMRDLVALGGGSVTLLDPLAPPAARRWAVTSNVIDGILSADGFVVTNPRLARGLGIQAGDTIVSVDAHPPTGLLAVVIPLQRDPDRATVTVEIDRAGNRLIQVYRVR